MKTSDFPSAYEFYAKKLPKTKNHAELISAN